MSWELWGVVYSIWGEKREESEVGSWLRERKGGLVWEAMSVWRSILRSFLGRSGPSFLILPPLGFWVEQGDRFLQDDICRDLGKRSDCEEEISKSLRNIQGGCGLSGNCCSLGLE